VQLRTAQDGAFESRDQEIGVIETRLAEVGAAQVGPHHARVGQIRLNERRTGQVGADERCVLQRGAAEPCPAEIDGPALNRAELLVACRQREIVQVRRSFRIGAAPGVPGAGSLPELCGVLRIGHLVTA
jgi:hypothetical protein